MRFLLIFFLFGFVSCAESEDSNLFKVEPLDISSSGDIRKDHLEEFFYSENPKVLDKYGPLFLTDSNKAESIFSSEDVKLKHSFYKLLKEDLSTCLGVFDDFRAKEKHLMTTLSELELDNKPVEELDGKDHHKIYGLVLSKSKDLVIKVMKNKQEIGPCVSKLAKRFENLDLVAMKSTYAFKSMPKKTFTAWKKLKSVNCSNLEESTKRCTTNIEVACEVKALLKNKRFLDAKDKMIGVNLANELQCYDDWNVSSIYK